MSKLQSARKCDIKKLAAGFWQSRQGRSDHTAFLPGLYVHFPRRWDKKIRFFGDCRKINRKEEEKRLLLKFFPEMHFKILIEKLYLRKNIHSNQWL